MKLKSRKKRTVNQRYWLERQINDPYVKKAKENGYKSRAAFKLLEIDQKYKLLKKGQHILDLGAAPGGWSQIMSQKGCIVMAIDLLKMDPIEHVTFIEGDFRSQDFKETFDGIVSDISPSASGIPNVDHLKLVGMIEDMMPIIEKNLKPGGFFICKVFKGGLEIELLNKLKKQFKKVSHIKPPASRKESREEYFIAQHSCKI